MSRSSPNPLYVEDNPGDGRECVCLQAPGCSSRYNQPLCAEWRRCSHCCQPVPPSLQLEMVSPSHTVLSLYPGLAGCVSRSLSSSHTVPSLSEELRSPQVPPPVSFFLSIGRAPPAHLPASGPRPLAPPTLTRHGAQPCTTSPGMQLAQVYGERGERGQRPLHDGKCSPADTQTALFTAQ